MAGSPRVVAADISFEWDGVPWRLQRGQVIDVPPDSDLERAIGANMLTPLGGVAAQPAPEAAEDAQDEADDDGDAEAQPSGKTSRSAAKDTAGGDTGADDAGTDGGAM